MFKQLLFKIFNQIREHILDKRMFFSFKILQNTVSQFIQPTTKESYEVFFPVLCRTLKFRAFVPL